MVMLPLFCTCLSVIYPHIKIEAYTCYNLEVMPITKFKTELMEADLMILSTELVLHPIYLYIKFEANSFDAFQVLLQNGIQFVKKLRAITPKMMDLELWSCSTVHSFVSEYEV